MRLLRRAIAVLAVAVVPLVLAPGPASAHPLGNFTINTHSGIVVEPERITVRYVVDMAEIPTFRELRRIDTNRDGTASPAERAAYAAARVRDLATGVTLEVDGRAAGLRVDSATAQLLQGQGGLSVLRVEAELSAAGSFAGSRIEFEDGNFAGSLGWREVTAVATNGVVLRGSSVPARSSSDELHRYPQDPLSDPPSMTSATFSVARGSGGAESSRPGDEARAERPGTEPGGFARLATWAGLSLPVVLLALALAMGFGAVHALLPGHGKTIMAAYLVGSGGRAVHAVQVAVAVALMHTASVLALGLVVLALASVAPERVYPWLTMASGIVVLLLGAGMLRRRLRTRPPRAPSEDDHSVHHAHEHGPHTHSHGPAHPADVLGERPLSRRSLSALALSGGILPSPTALVVLLSTVHADRIGFGLGLILAFSVGMAATLAGIGLLALGSRNVLAARMHGRVGRLVPVASAATILGVGTFLVARAALQL